MKHSFFQRLRAVISIYFLVGLAGAHLVGAATAQDRVNIQLKWFHQFQFAGYYAAIEKGYYAEEGLDVELIERDPTVNNIDEVVTGNAEYGVADAGLMLSRLQGKPVVILAQIFQHSPLVYVTLRESGLRTPFDLRGKKVMTESLGYADAALNAMLLKSLDSLSEVSLQQHSYRYQDLIEGRTDAILAYATNEPFWFRERGVDIDIIDPRDYGIDFYGDNLFTTDSELRDHPERAAKITRATLKGWKYALENKAEIINLILAKYNTQNWTRQHLEFEADQTEAMINPRFIELGHFEPSRYQKIAEIYTQLALADKFLVDEKFYYQPQKVSIDLSKEEQTWLEENRTIRVHNETAWPPFNFFDEDKPSGFSIDYMNLLAGKVGLQIEYVTGPTWNEFLEMMKSGDLDVMLNIVKTPDRQKYLLYTPPYANNPNTILSRRDQPFQNLEELFGKTVSVPKGFFYEEILKRDFPQIEVQTVDSTLDSMKEVSFGAADAAFGELAVFKHLMTEHLITDLSVSGEVKLGNPEFALLNIATRKDLPALASILTKAVKAVSREEKRAIQAKWFPTGEPTQQKSARSQTGQTDLPAERTTKPILVVVAISIVLLLIFGFVVFLLGRGGYGKDLSSYFGAAGFRIAVLIGLSALVSLVVIMNWLALTDSHKRTSVRVERELQSVIHGSINRLSSWINDRQAFLQQLGRDPRLVEITRDLLSVNSEPNTLKSSQALAVARSFFEANDQFSSTGFFIIAPDGTSIGSRRDANVGSPNFIAQVLPDRIDKVFQGETMFIPPIRSDVEIAVDNDGGAYKPLTMFFAVPITDKDGSVLAVLTERLLPSGTLSDILRLGRIGKSGETYAVNADAKMVSESRFIDELIEAGLLNSETRSAVEIDIRDPGGNMIEGFRSSLSRDEHAKTLMMAELLQLRTEGSGAPEEPRYDRLEYHPSSIDAYRDYRGVPVIGVWTWLPHLDIGLTVEMDHAEAFEDFFDFRFNLVLISGITLLIAVGTTLFTLLVGQGAHRSLSLARDHLEERVEQRTQELSDAYEIISGSIKYASNIQRSMLPRADELSEIFKEFFLIWEPRDVVGGDIYWKRDWGNGVLVGLADCTGHGVPGAFMTLISTSALDRALEKVPEGKVGSLVQEMHQFVQLALGQHEINGLSDDGLELGAVYLDSDMSNMTFVGARFSLFVNENGAVKEIKGKKQAIGYRGIPFEQEYDEIKVTVRSDCSYFMATDGLTDQVGGERRRMFSKKRLKGLLEEISQLPMREQKQRIEHALADYQGSERRRDDVSVIGFKV